MSSASFGKAPSNPQSFPLSVLCSMLNILSSKPAILLSKSHPMSSVSVNPTNSNSFPRCYINQFPTTKSPFIVILVSSSAALCCSFPQLHKLFILLSIPLYYYYYYCNPSELRLYSCCSFLSSVAEEPPKFYPPTFIGSFNPPPPAITPVQLTSDKDSL